MKSSLRKPSNSKAIQKMISLRSGVRMVVMKKLFNTYPSIISFLLPLPWAYPSLHLTDKIFGGNPACVEPLHKWLEDETLLKIAQ